MQVGYKNDQWVLQCTHPDRMVEPVRKRAKRSPAFTPEEMSILVAEVWQKRDTLFGRRKGKLSSVAKNRIWYVIAEKMAPLSPCGLRDWVGVRKKWQEFQSQTKKKAARVRLESQGIGGGGPGDTTLTPDEEKVMSIIGKSASEGIEGGVDVLGDEGLSSPTDSSEEPPGSGTTAQPTSPAPNISLPNEEPCTPPSSVPIRQHAPKPSVCMRGGLTQRPCITTCSKTLVGLERDKLAVLRRIEGHLEKSTALQQEMVDLKRQKLELQRRQLALAEAQFGSISVPILPQDSELPQQHVAKEEEADTDQQLCNQERKSSVDREDRESLPIKEEEEVEQLELKQETETFILTGKEESHYQLLSVFPEQHIVKEDEEGLPDHQLYNQWRDILGRGEPDPLQIKEEEEELCSSLEGEQLLRKQETETFMLTSNFEESDNSEPEPNSHHSPIYHKCPIAGSKDEKRKKPEDPQSTAIAEPKRGLCENTHHSNNEYNSATTKTHCNTPTGKKSLKCEICEKDFQFKSKLIIHMRSHTGEKPYLCKSCGKSFSQTAHLNEHLKIHRDEKPYPCEICGKGHRTSKALLIHIRTHTGEKPYWCKLCGKSFSQKSHLNEHLKTHQDERRYSCKMCGKGLRSRKALVIHMRIHTGEKPYSCDACGKRFSHKSSLNSHLKIHTDGRPYSCKKL